MGQADIALRHVTRQHPEELARGLLPPGLADAGLEIIGWYDSQLTALERRLDKALDLRIAGERRLLHVEIELDMDGGDPYRVWEYRSLLLMALHAEVRKASRDSGQTSQTKPVTQVPVLSVVIVLRGRSEPWPVEAAYSTGWREVAFSGTHFRVEAVYQRTVAELRARGALLWLVFTPLATDATAAAMREVLAEIRERVPAPEERADLHTAIMVMAEIDPWGHNLRKEISAMLQADDLEILKLSPTLRGAFEDGERNVLRALFAAQAGRAPTPDEQEALLRRVYELGPDGTLGAVLKLHGEALAAWLLGPTPAVPHAR